MSPRRFRAGCSGNRAELCGVLVDELLNIGERGQHAGLGCLHLHRVVMERIFPVLCGPELKWYDLAVARCGNMARSSSLAAAVSSKTCAMKSASFEGESTSFAVPNGSASLARGSFAIASAAFAVGLALAAVARGLAAVVSSLAGITFEVAGVV